MSMEWYYALIIVVLAVGLIGALIYVRTKVSKNVIKHVRAKLARTETERSEFEGPDEDNCYGFSIFGRRRNGTEICC